MTNRPARVAKSLSLLGMVLLWTSAIQAAELQRPEAGKKIKVFVLAGQSNMEGRADGDKLPSRDRTRLANVQGRVQLAYNSEPVCALGTVRPPEEIAAIYNVEHIFGPELFFGVALAEAWPDERILLIKYTAGATSLYGAWNPDWSADKAAAMGEESEPKLYPAMTTYVNKVLAGYRSDQYEILAMLWVQGETDTGREPAESAYGGNLRTLVECIRLDTRCAHLPFLLFQVGGGKVVEGMRIVAREVPRVHLIPQSSDADSSDFYQKIENGHYNHEGQKKLGLRFAECFLGLDGLPRD